MTVDEYFKEKLTVTSGSGCSGTVVLEESFPGFQGHFPGMKVFPGICSIMLARCLLEKHLRKKLTIRSIRKAKFFAPALPGDILHPEGTFTEENGLITASVLIYSGNGVKTADVRFTLAEVMS